MLTQLYKKSERFYSKTLSIIVFQPVEDLMLSSIHAFSVELRLASESVLGKVKYVKYLSSSVRKNPLCVSRTHELKALTLR